MNLNILKYPIRIFPVLCALLIAPIISANETSTRIICFGDSITKRGYPAELEQILGVEVIPAGVAGHTSAEGLARMQADVIDKEPSHVIIFFGTNDNRIDAPHKYQTNEQYSANIRQMIKRCRKIDAKVILCTIPPINYETYFTRHETAEYDKIGGLDKMLKNTRKAVVKLGKEFDLPVVDLNRELKKHPEWMHPDGVHPSPDGNRIIAELVAEKARTLIEKD